MTPASVADPIRLGTRASLLARTQSATVGDALAAVAGRPWAEVLITTSGDDTSKPLSQPGTPGLFVSTLRQALLAGEVDVIVHSFKDLPSAPEPGITIAAVPRREDPRDALVSRDGIRIEDLAPGCVIGTSSPRRAAVIARRWPNLVVQPVRGNVDSRIRKVRDGECDAVVLAMAGIVRIGRQDEVTQVFEVGEMLPAPAQGALAVECRSDDDAMLALLSLLDNAPARLATAAERQVLVGINAACTTAVGASASYLDGILTVRAELSDEPPVDHATAEVSEAIDPDDLDGARILGLRAAARLLGSGEHLPVLLIRSEGNENDAASLASHGLGVVSDPYVQISPVSGGDASRLVALLAGGDGSWLVATSPMTVPSLIAALGEEPLRAAVAQGMAMGLRAAATGQRTADSLLALGFDEVVVPQQSSAQGLVDALTGGGDSASTADVPLPDVSAGPGRPRAIFPRGNLALRTLPEGLRAKGWEVEEEVVYVTASVDAPPISVELIRRREVAAIVLRSPSAVRALVSFIRPGEGLPIICAGETTAAAAREAGLVVTAVSSSPSSAAVAATIAEVLAATLS